ncbi:MAG: acyl-CoA carboxylase biotin carboxyl carrier protein subunit [Sulfobacillus sp.]
MAEVFAEMAGVVARIVANVGDQVNSGQELLVVESMKMEIPLLAPVGGILRELRVGVGAFVQAGDVLAVVEP